MCRATGRDKVIGSGSLYRVLERGFPTRASLLLLFLCLSFSLPLCLSGCSVGNTVERGVADGELVIYCPHPLEFINPIVAEFESRTGIPVYVQTGGTGELLKMVEEGQEPECDVFWGGSLSTTVPKQSLFEPYTSKNEPQIQDAYRNEEGNMTRFTDIPSVLMVNTNLIGDLPMEGYGDLLRPELRGRIAMCDPANSSSAYEHLINMLYACGEGEPEDGWGYVELFCDNLDGRLLQSSAQVYQGVASGRFAVGLTFEEGAAHYVSGRNPVEIVYMREGVIFKPDVVCIVRGTDRLADAREFVDFVTGKDAQTIISADLDRRSVRTDVEAPENLAGKEAIRLLDDDEVLVNAKKKEWIGRFDTIFKGTLEK